MTAQELADLLSRSEKGITADRIERLKGAVLRENRMGNPVTFEQVIACLSTVDQQAVALALAKKGMQ